MSPPRNDNIAKLQEELRDVTAELAKAEDQVESLKKLKRDYERTLRKAGATYETGGPITFDDMDIVFDSGPPSKRPQYGKRAGDLFLQILIHMNKWMAPGELFRRAAFLGLKERRKGDFERSLQGMKRGRVRIRRKDGFVGLNEWPDEKR